MSEDQNAPHQTTAAEAPATTYAERAERQMVEAAQRVYNERRERAAMRCALSDAASLCDAIARDLADEHRIRGRGLTKLGQQLTLLATRCGNAIWQMREKVEVPHD